MAEIVQIASTKGPTAPYPAFQTLKTLAKQMKEHSVPSRIDRSVLTSFSGAVGSQVITMLKFLGLTEEDSSPTLRLKALVEAYDTDAWPAALGDVVRNAYRPMFQLNLETASPNQFNEHFRKTYPAADEVSRKSMTFFLNAAREATIKISPYIMKNKKPRSAPSKKKARAAGSAISPAASPAANPPGGAAEIQKKPSELVLGLLDPKEMKKEEQDAIWTLIKFFAAKGQ
jgi:hypothetical protein